MLCDSQNPRVKGYPTKSLEITTSYNLKSQSKGIFYERDWDNKLWPKSQSKGTSYEEARDNKKLCPRKFKSLDMEYLWISLRSDTYSKIFSVANSDL
jgi:hypothetical protein